MEMKAQMFLIAAFIIASFLIAGKIAIKSQRISVEANLLELSLENDQIENLVQELKNSARFSSLASMHENVFNFSDYVCKQIEKMAKECELLSVVTIANGSSLNVSIMNFLGKNLNFILNLSNASYSSVKYLFVNNKNRNSTVFNINPGSKYNLSISTNSYEEVFEIKTKKNEIAYNGFFDVKARDENFVKREKLQDYFLIK